MTKRERDLLGWLTPEDETIPSKKKRKYFGQCWGEGHKEWGHHDRKKN